ncbi:MAG: Ig-like domain-containing protein [Desulforhopalus sp.]
MRIFVAVVGLFVLLAVGCGGGGGDGQQPEAVNINSALRCSISMGGFDLGMVPIPANCGVAGIAGGSFETDQSFIHLAGSSFGPESDNCSNPTLTLDAPICIPIFPGSIVHWENLTNGVSGSGSSGYHEIGFWDPDWFIFSTYPDGAGWSTRNESYPAGIPLEMGANSIRVSVDDADNSGINEITVVRVTDVTPPSVYEVDPEPGGTYYFRVLVYFTEQLDPSDVTNTLQVFDSNGTPTPGVTEYDPLKLNLVWRPAAPLSRGAAYTARLSGIADLAGYTMVNPYEWSFTVY